MCLVVHVGCPEIEHDVDKKTKIDEIVEILDLIIGICVLLRGEGHIERDIQAIPEGEQNNPEVPTHATRRIMAQDPLVCLLLRLVADIELCV